ncbi:MAG: aldehyde dehydrogenase family protein, partial [Paracoccaceae bacterium]|nr:aldehyde dehydrogenase family protein [Paracoccaceae bacterium]
PLMSNFTPGPAWNENTDYSPIISEKQLARLETLVQQSVAQGAELCLGGKRYDTPGYFYKPTLLTGLDQNNVAIREEIFGPVLSLQTFNDFQEAMMLADHPVYGLCAGVYTQDLSTALNATKHIEAGTVWVNRYGRSRDHILPTGGYKSSGIGKDLGREAYHANRRSKTVLIDHQFS